MRRAKEASLLPRQSRQPPKGRSATGTCWDETGSVDENDLWVVSGAVRCGCRGAVGGAEPLADQDGGVVLELTVVVIEEGLDEAVQRFRDGQSVGGSR